MKEPLASICASLRARHVRASEGERERRGRGGSKSQVKLAPKLTTPTPNSPQICPQNVTSISATIAQEYLSLRLG